MNFYFCLNKRCIYARHWLRLYILDLFSVNCLTKHFLARHVPFALLSQVLLLTSNFGYWWRNLYVLFCLQYQRPCIESSINNHMILWDFFLEGVKQHQLEFRSFSCFKKHFFLQFFFIHPNNDHLKPPKNEREQKINDSPIFVYLMLINWTAVRKISSN